MAINFTDVTALGATSTPTATTKTTDSTGGLANQDTFLKLMMAQIRNQNPLNPTDGTQFLTQLAQFSTLEQNLGIREHLAAIRATLDERMPKPITSTEATGDAA